MKGGKTPLGYTIVEVMVVLAVSSAMFVVAASFINGKQAKTAFTEGANNMTARIQSLIDQVADGQYSDIFVNCSAGGVPGTITISPSGGPGQQGANSACVFLGKVMHFATNRSTFDIFSIAGSRLNSLGNQPNNPLDADAKPITALTMTQQIPQSLNITSVRVTDGSGTNTRFSIGFLQQAGFTGQTASGAQTIGLYYVSGSISNTDPTVTAQGQTIGSALRPAKFARICVSDGTRYAQIFIGTDNGVDPNYNSTVAKLKMNDTTPC